MPPSSGNDLDAHLDQLVEAARIRLDDHDKTEEGIRLKGAAFWKIQHEDGFVCPGDRSAGAGTSSG